MPLEHPDHPSFAKRSALPRGGQPNASPHSGRLRGGQGRVVTTAVGRFYSDTPQSAQSSPASSQGHSSINTLQDYNHHCPKGYKVYNKEDEDEADEWQQVRRKKGVTRKLAEMQAPGECGKSVKFNPNCTCPPKQDPVRRKLWRFGTRAYEGQNRLVLGDRGEFQQAEKSKNIRTHEQNSAEGFHIIYGRANKEPNMLCKGSDSEARVQQLVSPRLNTPAPPSCTSGENGGSWNDSGRYWTRL